MPSWRTPFLSVVAGLGLSGPGAAGAPAGTTPHPGLERLKTLEGEWAGPAVWDQGGKKGRVDFKLTYRITSGGRAVAETMFSGTPGEMLTVYYVDSEDLVLVHYCSAGNQPRMKLEPSGNPSELAFRCVGGTNMKESDSHMHSARITIVDADHITGAWSSTKEGSLEWVAEAELTRQR